MAEKRDEEERRLERSDSDLFSTMKDVIDKVGASSVKAKNKIDRLEMEIEVLKKEMVEAEKEVREVERSKRLRIEEEMRDKVDEKDKDIADLKKKVEDLEYVNFNNVNQLSRTVEGLEMEIEVLKKEKAETENKVREVESKLGVLESEERSKRLRVEEEMRDKVDEKDKDIAELTKKVEDLEFQLWGRTQKMGEEGY